MASITREANGRRTIQFVAADGKRRSIRLGKVSQRVADEIKIRKAQRSSAVGRRCEWVVTLPESFDALADILDLNITKGKPRSTRKR